MGAGAGVGAEVYVVGKVFFLVVLVGGVLWAVLRSLMEEGGRGGGGM